MQTALGLESAQLFEPDKTAEALIAEKREDGFVTPEAAAADVLWCLTASDAAVPSGKVYAERKPHAF